MAAALARSSGRLMIPNATSSSAQHRYRSCWLSMNGCGGAGGSDKAVGICETRTLASVSAPSWAVPQLKLAVSVLEANPPQSDSGIIRLQVPIRQRADALEWLQAQSQHQVLPRCFFSSRGQSLDLTSLSLVGNGGGLASTAKADGDEQELVSVAGVGSAVFFKGPVLLPCKTGNPLKLTNLSLVLSYQDFYARTAILFVRMVPCVLMQGLLLPPNGRILVLFTSLFHRLSLISFKKVQCSL
ncbi:unnamed protein product [Musa acuminata subsp. burmannicoides]